MERACTVLRLAVMYNAKVTDKTFQILAEHATVQLGPSLFRDFTGRDADLEMDGFP